MAAQEFEPQQPAQPEVVVQTPTQVEIPAAVEQGTGGQQIQAVPADPGQLVQPNGTVVAQPVPVPQDDANLPTFEVPDFQSEEQIEQYTHGNINNSVTWSAVGLLRLIHQKIKHGIRVVFGQVKQQ